MDDEGCSQTNNSSCSQDRRNIRSEASSLPSENALVLEARQRDNESGGFKEKLVNAFNDAVDSVKKKLGFVQCQNGGRRTTQGTCDCPRYFAGETCEDLLCANNGTKVTLPGRSPFCRCAHPEYISGTHCEVVKCDNNGQPLSNGHCRCLDYWYTGQFCENYTASWGAVIGVPLVCITIIVICCIICRLDFCPRRKVRHTRRRRAAEPPEPAAARTGRWVRNVEEQLEQRGAALQRGSDPAFRLQENLLNEENMNRSRGFRADPNAIPSYTIRLDTIPVFNPRMIGGVTEQDIKPMEPPPPYDQAVALNFPQQLNAQNSRSGLPRPPDYTPNPSQPPPPNIRPPDIPQS